MSSSDGGGTTAHRSVTGPGEADGAGCAAEWLIIAPAAVDTVSARESAALQALRVAALASRVAEWRLAEDVMYQARARLSRHRHRGMHHGLVGGEYVRQCELDAHQLSLEYSIAKAAVQSAQASAFTLAQFTRTPLRAPQSPFIGLLERDDVRQQFLSHDFLTVADLRALGSTCRAARRWCSKNTTNPTTTSIYMDVPQTNMLYLCSISEMLLAFSDATKATWLSTAPAPTVIDILIAGRNTHALQRQSWRAVWTRCCGDLKSSPLSKFGKAFVSSVNGINELAGAIARCISHPKLLREILRCVYMLFRGTSTRDEASRFQDSRTQFLLHGGAHAIVRAMQAHPLDAIVQTGGCAALAKVVLTTGSETRHELIEMGILTAVISAFTRFPSHGTTSFGFFIIHELVGQHCMLEQHAIQCVLGVTDGMMSLSEDLQVQYRGCMCLHLLATADDLEYCFCVTRVAFLAISAVLDAMRRHTERSNVQRHGLKVLAYVMARNPDAGKIIQLWRGGDLILTVVDRFASSRATLVWAVRALFQLQVDKQPMLRAKLQRSLFAASVAFPGSPIFREGLAKLHTEGRTEGQ